MENDRRRRFLPFDSGVKGSEFRLSIYNDRMIALGESDTERITTPAEVHETSAGRSDRWAVVVFDDTYHSMDYVIWALIKTFPEMSTTDATLIMLEAHNTGKGVVTLCGKEQAIQYRDALRILQLGCDVQPGW